MSADLIQGNPHGIVDRATGDLALEAFLRTIANMTLQGEERGGDDLPPFEQDPEDAVQTLQGLITKARDIYDRRKALAGEGAPRR